MSVDTTYDEALRCPRCSQKGQDISKTNGPHGSKIHSIMCMNTRCRWYNTSYVVQVHADGTVQPPTLSRDRHFPKLPDRNNVEAQMQELYDQTTRPGTEVR